MSTTAGAETLWPEDTVEYHLYSSSDTSPDSLTKLAVECTHYVRLFSKGHIWNYSAFVLSVWAGKEGSQTHCLPPHLWGSTCFRDNIQDEWLVVYLLFMLSKRFPQLVISIADADGQFLLIEAAHHLPKWLKPESSENRVFIHKGHVHIVPKPSSPAEVTLYPVATPTIEQAIRLVSNDVIPTKADAMINQCIEERLRCFSAEPLENVLHHTHCYLPYPVAHVISHDPQILSAAVHALCDRDPNDMVYCRTLKHFSPSRHGCVMSEVKFTRYLYARLLHERFSTPRNSGFNVPPVGNPRHKACDLGMKLTCGLEILLGRVSGDCGGVSGSVDGNPRWGKFVKSLKDKGYFQNELEGSRLYKQLLVSAKEYFVTSVQTELTEQRRDPLTIAGEKIVHILQSVPYSEEELTDKANHLNPPNDDSWLEVGPDDLDEMLRKASGYLPKDRLESRQQDDEKHNTNSLSEGQDLDLQSMVFGMKSFVDKTSSHKGAEFPWSVDDAKAVDFNPETFLSTLKSMLDRANENNIDSDSDVLDEEDTLSISDNEEGQPMDDNDGGDRDMEEVMAQMDQELAQTEVGKSFEKLKVSETDMDDDTCKHVRFEEPEESEERGDDLQPVDVDFNLVKNLLDSYTSQGGGAGPASNILHSMGVLIPDHDQESH